MDRATKVAERTIAVLSPDYLDAHYTQPEWAAAFRRDLKGDQGTLLPVRVQKCEIEGLLGSIVYIDLVGLDEQAACDKLLADVRRGRAKPPTAPAFPRSVQPTVSERPSFPGRPFMLNRCESLHEVEVTLHSRLCHLDELADLCRALEHELARPFLTPWHILPDLPHPALIRTLGGHTGAVYFGCAVSPSGDFIVSASVDKTLKVWDARTGAERFTLHGHTSRVNDCAVSPSDDYIVSASGDGTLKVWDAHTGTCVATLHVDGSLHACACHLDGEHIVAFGAQGVYFLRLVR